MAYPSAPIADDIIWRAAPQPEDASLADAVRETIASTRKHLLDFIRLDETPPPTAMTLAQWTRPAAFRSLLAAYSDHIYRHTPGLPRENKPLLSLWAQWYIGLMAPPLMLALLTQARAINVSAEHIHVEFHETGRAACFWLDVHQDNLATGRSPEERMETLIVSALQPVIQALEATGDINAKLIWSNTGYLINWYLTEMKPLLGEALLATLRQRCFFEKQLSDGQDNPLWRTVVMRDGLLVRRTCCQRYRLPDVQQCGDCTLK
ncbi:hydroxamate siderophore iron reductase FhuF [Salmonella enterica subsp. enterica serovar Stanleyville]|uniref:siderophore-iron reductase FhuF n=1 Tax=Salmonella enterica TaxID=28901 RepID=UPI0008AA6646|nr:siderophore-iron reductase FhuF [Salmonella enterica]EBQ9566822.1 hydroxamate siderophore iron reductase FhuF [Salmonella enterica subsp. enterica serovar Stanleyville]AOZ30028.1 hydroxamate siderophore iron reductase FhuF [Salmonella enterica subsp. enterica serovar Saintpaul str. SARA26]EBS3859043.1 hydroxamate siderophore iron reductase FhuF [Salmonella enterica subsp. enterica serovar Stanleyville]EBW9553291.1 hydroxamate siderophore iron reductase FhuF [Salmonella enterica subsp. enteri